MRTELDHLVVACADLDQGSAWCERTLGVAVQAGGKHVTMGTHNRLLKLGPRVFLELIAIDPEAEPPARPRWFDLDRPDVQARAAAAPFLIAWVARCEDIDRACALVPALGEPTPFTRGSLSWRFSLPDDGALQFGGALPSVLQWAGAAHPCDALEDRGCTLQSFDVRYPAADRVIPLYRALRVSGPVNLAAGDARLSALIDTPSGMKEIS